MQLLSDSCPMEPMASMAMILDLYMHITSLPLVPLDSCLTAAACLSSACSFAGPQASDLMLLVGNVA